MNSKEISEQDAYVALGGVRRETVDKDALIGQLTARLQILRMWIHDVDWEALCKAMPEAAHWFDEDKISK